MHKKRIYTVWSSWAFNRTGVDLFVEWRWEVRQSWSANRHGWPEKELGSLRWDDGYARERQAEVKHKNTGLLSVFIHPSNFGGNCKTTLVSSHRKRSLLFLYFPVGNSVCQLFALFISRIPLLYYVVHFVASFCQGFPNRMWIQWTDWATAVCSWSWCSRQRRP